jgi:thioredoxin-like negative regulator of GroEL
MRDDFNSNSGGPCDEGQKCDKLLDDLENIDDEADESGIQLVTTEETGFANKFGITTFPTLAFFRNGEPLIYKGSLSYN